MAAQAVRNLQTFSLDDLAVYTNEGVFAKDASSDFRLFFAGRDNVHGVLKHLLERVTVSCYLNMFGYDDDDLNAILMSIAENPQATMLVTLDKSQSGGVHEKAILASDAAKDPQAFSSHFAIGQSATHQISHTKGATLDGVVGFEGSTNWSVSGEGTFVLPGKAGGAGFKAQNNTLAVFTDPFAVAKFTAELVHEHQVVVAQGGVLTAK